MRGKIQNFDWNGKYRRIEESGFRWFDGPNVADILG